MDTVKDAALIFSMLLGASGIGAIIVAIINKIPTKQNALQVNVDIITKLSNQVSALADEVQAERSRGDQLEQRLDEVELQLRKVKNAYRRAMNYIYQKKAPDETVPDFMTDTGDLKPK